MPTNPELRKFIVDHFNDAELTILIADYFEPYQTEEKPGLAIASRAQDLIGYCKRTGQLPNLEAALQQKHPRLYSEKFGTLDVAPIEKKPRDPRQCFISHAHQDARFAQRLASDLRDAGVPVWIAPDSIQPGELMVSAIDRGLDECGVFIAVLTPNAPRSKWVRTETQVALQMWHREELTIVPLMVEECNVSLLSNLVATIQHITFAHSYNAGFHELKQKLAVTPPTANPLMDMTLAEVAPPSPKPATRPPKRGSRKRPYDVAKAQDLQAVAQQSDELHIFEQRAAVNRRVCKALSEDKMSKIRSEEDFEIFLARVDYENILREEERSKLIEEFRNAGTDRTRAREHILAVADIEGRYELEMLRLKRTHGLTAAEFEFKAAQTREKAKFETDIALQRVDFELAIRRAKEDFERESARIADADARTRQLQAEKDAIEKAMSTAQTKSEIADLERQEDEKDAELGLRLLERMKAIRRHDDFEREIRRRQTAREELEDRLVERKAVFEQDQARVAQEHRFKLDYAAKLGEIGGKDALIALAEETGGQLLKELAETREYRGMSPEQLEMLMAGKSGAMAQALIEKYKAQASQGQGLSQEQTKLYERLVQMTQDTARREADALRDAMKDQKDMAEKLGRMIRDVGLGGPGQTQAPPIIVVGGGMSLPSTPAALTPGAPAPAQSPSEVWVCPKCERKSKPGVKFCANCGHKYYD